MREKQSSQVVATALKSTLNKDAGLRASVFVRGFRFQSLNHKFLSEDRLIVTVKYLNHIDAIGIASIEF